MERKLITTNTRVNSLVIHNMLKVLVIIVYFILVNQFPLANSKTSDNGGDVQPSIGALSVYADEHYTEDVGDGDASNPGRKHDQDQVQKTEEEEEGNPSQHVGVKETKLNSTHENTNDDNDKKNEDVEEAGNASVFGSMKIIYNAATPMIVEIKVSLEVQVPESTYNAKTEYELRVWNSFKTKSRTLPLSLYNSSTLQLIFHWVDLSGICDLSFLQILMRKF